VLWFKTGPGPVVPDPVNLKRLTGQRGQRQGGSYDLPAAFHIRSINVYHDVKISFYCKTFGNKIATFRICLCRESNRLFLIPIKIKKMVGLRNPSKNLAWSSNIFT
jgi:hypothetical protein